MACSGSPFSYSDVVATYAYNENLTVKGSVNVPEYSAGTEVCSLCWQSGWCSSCCKYKECVPWTSWCWTWNGPGFCNPSGWSWCDCTSVDAEVIPAFTMSAKSTVPLTIEAEEGTEFTATAPPTGYVASSVVCNPFSIDITVDGETIEIPMPVTLTLTEKNGEFSASIPLGSYSSKDSLMETKSTFTFSLTFCGSGPSFMVLVVSCSIKYDGYSETLPQFNCPISDIVEG